MTVIRFAKSFDRDAIRCNYLDIFPESENRAVADLAAGLLTESSYTFNLVADSEGQIVGHVAFSPLTATTEKNWKGYILAPLAVKPECQKQGIGSKLVKTGIEQLKKKAIDMLFVYGDPKYYERFGFTSEAAQQFVPPYKLTYPTGWQAMMLNQYSVSESEARLSCVVPLCNPALW